MTTAGGPGNVGPGGMSFGDDYVAARLSIDIPEGSVEGIREITQEVERFRITMEAATRVSTDMSRYLEEMGQASKAANMAQAELVNTLERYQAVTGRMGGGMPMPTVSGVPGGAFQQPFGPTGAGMGAAPGSRPVNPSDVPSQLGMAQSNNPREWLNMQHARGGLTAQDVVNLSPQSIQDLANKIADREHGARQQALHTQSMSEPRSPGHQIGAGGLAGGVEGVQKASSLAGRVMNELAPGGTAMGLGSLAVAGLNWANRRSAQAAGRKESTAQAPTSTRPGGLPTDENAPGMGGTPAEAEAVGGEAAQDMALAGGSSMLGKLGGLGKFLGPIAGVATAALATFGAIQGGGQLIQGFRNTAAVRGGAAGEGAEVELKARVMAMNPFITSDQARQIYQTVMSEGYAGASGSGADNVIGFMKDNLTQMNISVADSAKMLRSTVVGSGKGDAESVQGAVEMLRTELDTIRTLSRESVISTPEYTEQVMQLQNTLMARGASPEAAARAAMSFQEIGSKDQAFKGQMSLAAGDFTSDSGGAMLQAFGGADVPRGLMPGLTMAYLSETGQSDEAVWNTLRRYAQMYARMDKGDYASRMNAVYLFQKMVQRVAPSMSAANNLGEAKGLYLKLLGNEEIGKANARIDAQPGVPEAGHGLDVSPLPSAAFTPNTPPALPGGSTSTAAGHSSGREPTTSAPPLVGPSASSRVSGEATVQISLSPEAARVLQVSNGPNVRVPLSSVKQAANRGFGGASVNAQGVE